MNENIVQFPKAAHSTERENTQKKRAKTIADKVESAKSALKAISRGISESDKLRITLNLGHLIEDLAQSEEFNGDKKKALKQVWEKWGQKEFSKRLRYIRFIGEENSKDVISSSGLDFIKLAETIANLSQSTIISKEDLRIEFIRQLLSGTEFDVDPVNNAKIDFDALKEMGEILEYMLKSSNAIVPELDIYFKRIVESGVVYGGPLNEENLLKIRGDEERWPARINLLPELNDRPKDFGLIPELSSTAMNYEGRLEAEKLCNGLTFDLEDRFTDLHFPKAYLGKMTIERPIGFFSYDEEKYQAIKRNLPNFGSLANTHSNLDDIEIENIANEAIRKFADGLVFDKELCTLEIEVFLAITYLGIGNAARTQLSIILWPSTMPSSMLSVSHLIAELNTQPIQKWENEVIHVESLAGFIKHDEASEFVEEFLGGAIVDEIRNCVSVHWGTQSSTAKKIFAIENINFVVDETDRSDDDLLTAVFNPNFKVPDEYAPISTRTLAGQLIRNILYADGDENILEQLIADAKLRIEWVNEHFRDWQAQYLSAKKKLKSKFSISILGNNDE